MAINLLTDTWDQIEKLFDGSSGPGWSSSLDGLNVDDDGMIKPGAVASAKKTGSTLSTMGLITQGIGAVTSAVGTYYAAQSQQYQAKSQASNYQFQADMARMNASSDERNAETILEAGKSQIANYTMQAGQEKSDATASMAARGIALGVGSAADVSASMDVVKDINVLNINSNTVRAAANERMQGANELGEADLYGASAKNALATAGSISPTANTMASLLTSAGQIGGQWDWRNWMRQQGFGGVS